MTNMIPVIILLPFLGIVFGNPLIPRATPSEPISSPVPSSGSITLSVPSAESTCYTSSQWLIISNTSIFWPTSTDYFYGPTTGPGASDVICAAKWIQYRGRSLGLLGLGPTATSTVTTLSTTSTGACWSRVGPEIYSDTHTGPLTTLCDGYPRALGPRETATEYYPGTGPCSTSSYPRNHTTTLYIEPSASPTCRPQSEGCISAWQTYRSLSSEYHASITSPIPGDTRSPLPPNDCPNTPREYPEDDPCTDCHFLPGTATMYYWPVTTANGDLCAQNGTTIPATATGDGPNTAILDDHTLVSPSIYLSFTSIRGWSNRRHGHQCGASHYNEMISVHPTAISSRRGHRNARYPIIGTAFPFNFAEFLPQTLGNYTQSVIPWPQYRGGGQCPVYDPSCTMVRDDYVPFIDMPDEVTSIDSHWKNCDRSWFIPAVTLVPIIDGTAIAPTPTGEPEAMATEADAAPQGFMAAPTPTPTSEPGW
ncbi:hypothetical protein BDV23DRAFT_143853 [Aspergillus alliaceus]|uniref:Glycosyl hydrolase family 61-domain-containing protein n=1 Tax=Petromyces alliaceus TaxID=209559 RepID=A0A5N7CRL4_PETAA|nr:hypothetical protein BDV23DRAFT_143853 [Aspergillus alliaceus]